MRIDKVTPFYTLEDRKALAGFDRETDTLLEEARDLSEEVRAAQRAGDEELLKELVSF